MSLEEKGERTTNTFQEAHSAQSPAVSSASAPLLLLLA